MPHSPASDVPLSRVVATIDVRRLRHHQLRIERTQESAQVLAIKCKDIEGVSWTS